MRMMSATIKRKKPGFVPHKDKTTHRYEVQRRHRQTWYKVRSYADANEARSYIECELVDSTEDKPRMRVVDDNSGTVIFQR